MPPEGQPRPPKRGLVLVFQLCLLFLLFPQFAASQPLTEVEIPGNNPFIAPQPVNNPSSAGLPLQANGGQIAAPPLEQAVPAVEAPAPEQEAQPLTVGVPENNPFIASSPITQPSSLGPPTQANGQIAAPTLEQAVPAAEAPAPEQEAQLPCACTTTGMSGNVNTSTIGCGQWLVPEGSNVFICYIAVSHC